VPLTRPECDPASQLLRPMFHGYGISIPATWRATFCVRMGGFRRSAPGHK
jgi:hypothetical protein